jgi:dienelactone hydrolase
MPGPLDDFTETEFEHDGKRRTVYRIGEGPAVIVMTEIPNITPAVAAFARRVAEIGCSAWVPDLFGEAGREPSFVSMMQTVSYLCVAREFGAFAFNSSAPVTRWLRALAGHAHDECGGPGVGAVGMCFTGGFALAMMLDDRMLAPVLSQPASPFPVSKKARRSLGLSSDEIAKVRARADDGVCVLGLRFTGDRTAPAERFARLREELGDAFVGVEIDSSKGNEWGIPSGAHSVLTEALVDEPGHPTYEALHQVLDLFRARLLEPTA